MVILLLTLSYLFWKAYSSGQETVDLYFYVACLVEAAAICLISFLRKKYKSNYQSPYREALEPGEHWDYQSERYLIFRGDLKRIEFSGQHANKCLQIFDDAISSTIAINYPKVAWGLFSTGIIGALITETVGQLSDEKMFTVTLIAAMISLLIYAIAPFPKSKVAKLKELRYFVRLYASEHSNDTRPETC